MSADSTRELRAMYLVALPYPPLPCAVASVEADSQVAGADVVTTTHTIISECLQQAMGRNDPAANLDRMKRQQATLQRFLHDMAHRGFQADAATLYELYATHTRAHVDTFFPEGARYEGMRILPHGHTCAGDRSHAKLCEYLAGQSVLHEDPAPMTTEALASESPDRLLLMCRDRLGRVATEEDMAQIRAKSDA
jgi:hypothetical protein